MKRGLLNHLLIVLPVVLLAYTQLVLKWQANAVGGAAALDRGVVSYFLAMLLNPWTATAILASLCAMLSWFIVLGLFPISYAYPFVSLSFLLVGIGGVVILGEHMNIFRLSGLVLIVIGVFMTAKGQF